MSGLSMILFDGTELSLDAFGIPMHAVMTCANEDDMLSKWKQLTPMQLSRVEVRQNGEPVFVYGSGRLDGQQSVINGDGTLTVHFFMSGVRLDAIDATTQEYVTAAQIMLGEEE